MQSQLGVTLLETKDHQQTPEARAEAWDRGPLSASEGTNPADTLILDFWPPERGRPPVCGPRYSRTPGHCPLLSRTCRILRLESKLRPCAAGRVPWTAPPTPVRASESLGVKVAFDSRFLNLTPKWLKQ